MCHSDDKHFYKTKENGGFEAIEFGVKLKIAYCKKCCTGRGKKSDLDRKRHGEKGIARKHEPYYKLI